MKKIYTVALFLVPFVSLLAQQQEARKVLVHAPRITLIPVQQGENFILRANLVARGSNTWLSHVIRTAGIAIASTTLTRNIPGSSKFFAPATGSGTLLPAAGVGLFTAADWLSGIQKPGLYIQYALYNQDTIAVTKGQLRIDQLLRKRQLPELLGKVPVNGFIQAYLADGAGRPAETGSLVVHLQPAELPVPDPTPAAPYPVMDKEIALSVPKPSLDLLRMPELLEGHPLTVKTAGSPIDLFTGAKPVNPARQGITLLPPEQIEHIEQGAPGSGLLGNLPATVKPFLQAGKGGRQLPQPPSPQPAGLPVNGTMISPEAREEEEEPIEDPIDDGDGCGCGGDGGGDGGGGDGGDGGGDGGEGDGGEGDGTGDGEADGTADGEADGTDDGEDDNDDPSEYEPGKIIFESEGNSYYLEPGHSYLMPNGEVVEVAEDGSIAQITLSEVTVTPSEKPDSADGNTIYLYDITLGKWLPVDTNTGGSGGTPDNSSPTISIPGDHILKASKLPANNNKDTQFPNWCVFKTMEWIAAFFGSTTLSSDIALYCSQMLNNINILSQGFQGTIEQLNQLIDHYFASTACTNVSAAIDAGHPVMGFLYNSGSTTDGHEVFIMGYNNDGTYEYFDPESGTYKSSAPASFNDLQEISGVK